MTKSTSASSSSSARIRTIYHALKSPDRLKALADCDKNLLSYDPSSFLLIFRVRGRHFGLIAPPLFALLLWDIGWALYLVTFQDPLAMSPTIQSMNDLISPLLTPVSFLLVFRLGRAAVRFWDSRSAIGKIVEICRTLASTALVGCRPHPRYDPSMASTIRLKQHQLHLAENFIRWIAVFPMAAKNFLRPFEGLQCCRSREVGEVLSAKDKAEFLGTGGDQFAPILVLNRLRQLVYEVSSSYPQEKAALGAALFRQLNENLDTLTGAWGAMERINGTPLPFVYVVHLRTFMLLYLFLWHVQAIASSGWIALLPLLLTSWGLLGVEAAAVECERPFQWQGNHLALGRACIVVSNNLAQTMANMPWMKHATDTIEDTHEETAHGRVTITHLVVPHSEQDLEVTM